MFERALHFKCSPDEAREYGDDVLSAAQLTDKPLAEVARWAKRDRMWLVLAHRGLTEAAPEVERRRQQKEAREQKARGGK